MNTVLLLHWYLLYAQFIDILLTKLSSSLADNTSLHINMITSGSKHGGSWNSSCINCWLFEFVF